MCAPQLKALTPYPSLLQIPDIVYVPHNCSFEENASKYSCIYLSMAVGYAKDQPPGFTNRIERVAIVGVRIEVEHIKHTSVTK